MKKRNETASEGALIVLLGMVLGMLLAFVFHEYGIRESRRGIASMIPTPKKKQTTSDQASYWDGKHFIQGSKA